MQRSQTRQINVGGVLIGGGAGVSIQSMCTTKTADVRATLSQLERLYACGCEIARVAVADEEDALAISELCEKSPMPLVADIHFDYRLAIAAAERGISKIRINPGNIGGKDRVQAVAKVCSERNIPIRIGVNSGSIDKRLLAKYGGVCAEAMVESAKEHAALLEECDFHDICISLKASDVARTVAAYRLAAEEFAYPLHLGVTEAGTLKGGIIKSAVGIGALLLDGIGDTIRVSLTAEPEEEIAAAKAILSAAGLRQGGVKLVSCPTCGRTQIDLISLANETEAALSEIDADIVVAVMGCVVNGPGEASEADFGIAGGRGEGVLFMKGKPIKKVSEDRLVAELLELIKGEIYR